MTGNLVFLGHRRVRHRAARTSCERPRALVSFAAGVALATRVIEGWRGSGTWPGYMPVVLGAGTIAQAGFLALWLAVSGDPSAGSAFVLVVLSAFAMGMQSGAVMSLRVEGVFTTAATATLLYLMRGLPTPSAAAGAQRRLAGVLVALVAGAAAGALLLDHARTLAPALPLVGVHARGRIRLDRSALAPHRAARTTRSPRDDALARARRSPGGRVRAVQPRGGSR